MHRMSAQPFGSRRTTLRLEASAAHAHPHRHPCKHACLQDSRRASAHTCVQARFVSRGVHTRPHAPERAHKNIRKHRHNHRHLSHMSFFEGARMDLRCTCEPSDRIISSAARGRNNEASILFLFRAASPLSGCKSFKSTPTPCTCSRATPQAQTLARATTERDSREKKGEEKK